MRPKRIMQLAEETYLSGVQPGPTYFFANATADRPATACVIGAAFCAKTGHAPGPTDDINETLGVSVFWSHGVQDAFDGYDQSPGLKRKRQYRAGFRFGQKARRKFLSPAPKEEVPQAGRVARV
jgi:hypothetical protein